MNKRTQLLEPQESFPKEHWIQYARALKAENKELLDYLRETRELLVWDSDVRWEYKRINELRSIIDALLEGEDNESGQRT